MNKEEQFEKLLKAYYEGTTTDEEEKLLRQYFDDKKEVPDSLLNESRWFRAISHLPSVPVPDDLEKRISDKIDAKASKEMYFTSLHRNHFNKRWFTGMVAGILLLIGSGVSVYKYMNYNDIPHDTFNNVAEAHKAVAVTLTEVSCTLNENLAELDINGREKIK